MESPSLARCPVMTASSVAKQRSFIAEKCSLIDLDSRNRIMDIMFKNAYQLVQTVETINTFEYSVDLSELRPDLLYRIYEIVNESFKKLNEPVK